MAEVKIILKNQVEKLYQKLFDEAEKSGYHLNPDADFAKDIIHGLLVNKRRYGYMACPCRLAAGKKQNDMDIICPCYYRDADIVEHDSCYCSLYVSQNVIDGKAKPESIPERRPVKERRKRKNIIINKPTASNIALTLPVWRCMVCGYLCAREVPPDLCPICIASKEHFERFI